MSLDVAVWPPPVAWPANILRFHLSFSEPMDDWRAMDHVTLLDDESRVLSAAFLDLPDGLWDAAGRTLTVLFHPARLKTGVGTLAPVLDAGRRHWLRVSGGLATAGGSTREADHLFAIGTGAAARQGFVLPRRLRPAGRRQPLTVDVGRPLDFLGLRHGLVFTAGGDPIPLEALLPSARGAVAWPRHEWPKAVIELHAAPDLEDVCGNRAEAPFEHAPP